LQIDPSTQAPALAGGSGSGFRPTGVVEGATGLPVGLHKKGVGRGGYLHQRAECWQGFLKRKSLYRAFRVEIDKGVKEKLVRELAKC